MSIFEAGDITLQRVREHVWEIPQEGEMRAPARVLASRPLLEQIVDDRSLEQLKNATHLPGIRKYALAMPDTHQGYGFPVGGVAGIDAEDGCISPGAIGYDINCIPGDTELALSHGRRLEIQELRERFEDETAMVVDDELVESDIQLFIESGDETVYKVETETGEQIEATEDHPFLTPDGMTRLDELEPGDTVCTQPFCGLEHEDPSDTTLLTTENFADQSPQIRRVLRARDILPLSTTDEVFNRLLKLVGFFTGDGSWGGEGQTWFYAEPEDISRIREDVSRIGFTPSKIYTRDRDHEIDGNRFESTEYSFKTTSRALRLLLKKLGAPVGEKASSGFETPWYFDSLTNWQKALYYSAYFGAEMSSPAAQRDTTLYCPTVSQNRSTATVESGRRFFEDLTQFLDDIGIETNELELFETDSNSDREMRRLRIGIKNDTQNLLKFFTRVGYTYNFEKQQRSVKAIQYLRLKQQEIRRRERIAEQARALADGGMKPEQIKSEFEINNRFVERSLWDGRKGPPRPGDRFPRFETFCKNCDVSRNLTVESEIVSIERVGRKPVYDIGVTHDAHNFLANQFVVANCGVRLLKTNLTYDDIRGREEQLLDSLFANVPTGLGGGAIARNPPIEDILQRGVEWAVEAGHGIESDIAHCEDQGCRPDADPAAVSEKARDRGRNQVGSLGSGNHFLEVQRVSDIYREEVAAKFGLERDQVVVLIHCGSRGLGHQVCTDYLREVEQSHQGLLNQLPDRELAAAPAGSQLAEQYYGAMCAAINFAWVNRQVIMHRTREVFGQVLGEPWEELGMELLYDVAHNIGKKEHHDVDGESRELYVHRKGATRAFPAGRPELPPAYDDVGQPVLIPGSMGAGSYILRGGSESLGETFGSTAHGAGRLMSRTQAKQEYWGEDVMDDLREQNRIYVKAESGATVAEEAPGVYKDVDEVVRVSDALDIGDRVARTYPICNIKG